MNAAAALIFHINFEINVFLFMVQTDFLYLLSKYQSTAAQIYTEQLLKNIKKEKKNKNLIENYIEYHL